MKYVYRSTDPTEKFPPLLVTLPQIARYMRCGVNTVKRWQAKERFPVVKLPSGCYAISQTLIDKWLLSRYTVVEDHGRKSQRD